MGDNNRAEFIFSHAHAAEVMLALPKVNNNPWNYIGYNSRTGTWQYSSAKHNDPEEKTTITNNYPACRSQIILETP